MPLLKISRTARSKHLGTYHYDLINAKFAKDVAGSGYHVYQKVTTEFGKTSWILVMK